MTTDRFNKVIERADRVMYKQKAVAADAEDKSTRRCLTPNEALKYNVANAR